MGFRSAVPDQDSLDRIERPHVMTFIAAHRFNDLIRTTVVALHKPVFHKHRLAVDEADRLGIAAGETRQHTTGAAVAVRAGYRRQDEL